MHHFNNHQQQPQQQHQQYTNNSNNSFIQQTNGSSSNGNRKSAGFIHDSNSLAYQHYPYGNKSNSNGSNNVAVKSVAYPLVTNTSPNGATLVDTHGNLVMVGAGGAGVGGHHKMPPPPPPPPPVSSSSSSSSSAGVPGDMSAAKGLASSFTNGGGNVFEVTSATSPSSASSSSLGKGRQFVFSDKRDIKIRLLYF